MLTLYPQFTMASGPAPGLTQLGRNNSTISYDSLQINYNLRMRNGLSLLGNYTFAKQVEQWGYLDAYTKLQQNGLYLPRPAACVQADRDL